MRAAIVTGVSRGLGEALAAYLLGQGWTVLGVGRSASKRLSAAGLRLAHCDLSRIELIERAVQPALGELAAAPLERVCLVNNAAVAKPVGVLGGLNPGELQASFAVNLAAPCALANVFLRVFDRQPLARRIVNVSSGAAQRALEGESLYCIAKAGLEMLTQSILAEHARNGVEAVTLRPGVIDTNMQTFLRGQSKDVLPSVDLFRGFHDNGQLVAPDRVAQDVARKIIEGDVENGRTYSYPADWSA